MRVKFTRYVDITIKFLFFTFIFAPSINSIDYHEL